MCLTIARFSAHLAPKERFLAGEEGAQTLTFSRAEGIGALASVCLAGQDDEQHAGVQGLADVIRPDQGRN